MADSILQELWHIKDDIAREHGYNARSLAAALMTRTETGHRVVDRRGAQPKPDPGGTDSDQITLPAPCHPDDGDACSEDDAVMRNGFT